MSYITTPCRSCGKPVVYVRAYRADGTWGDVALDPTVPVYVVEPDGEGQTVWTRVTSSAKDPADFMAGHFAVCNKTLLTREERAFGVTRG